MCDGRRSRDGQRTARDVFVGSNEGQTRGGRRPDGRHRADDALHAAVQARGVLVEGLIYPIGQLDRLQSVWRADLSPTLRIGTEHARLVPGADVTERKLREDGEERESQSEAKAAGGARGGEPWRGGW